MTKWLGRATVLMAVAVVGGTGTACASHAHGYRYAPDSYRIGFDRGFEDGAEHGEKDGRRHDGFDFAHDKKYRKGDSGYERHYGPRTEYAAGYRRGYELGYRRAYAGGGHRHGDHDGYCYLRHEDRYRSGDRYDPRHDRRGERDDDYIYERPPDWR